MTGPPVAELTVGERIGSYEIRSLLGQGGMGAVFLADDHSLDRRVAIKILPRRLCEDPEIVARFQREARAIAKLRHPNLMHIYSVGEHKGHPYFAMEYIRGRTLGAVLSKAGAIAPAQSVHILAEVMSALDKVHRAHIIHRDVKPGNIMIDEDSRAVLMDFGLARETEDVGLTADHTVLGTPTYMSPEQARGDPLDARTDIYSLGIVLYEMLVGGPPFKGKSSFEVLRHHIESSVPAPSHIRPEVPIGLDLALARAVAKSPDDRFQTVGEMAAALHEVCPNAVLARLIGDSGGATEPTRMMTQPATRFPSTIALPDGVRSAKTVRSAGPAASGARRPAWRRWLGRAAVAVAVVLTLVMARAMFRSAPQARRVEIRRQGAETVRGRLVAIEVLDDGTTTVKIEADGSAGTRSIRVEDGDVLHVLDER